MNDEDYGNEQLDHREEARHPKPGLDKPVRWRRLLPAAALVLSIFVFPRCGSQYLSMANAARDGFPDQEPLRGTNSVVCMFNIGLSTNQFDLEHPFSSSPFHPKNVETTGDITFRNARFIPGANQIEYYFGIDNQEKCEALDRKDLSVSPAKGTIKIEMFDRSYKKSIVGTWSATFGTNGPQLEWKGGVAGTLSNKSSNQSIDSTTQVKELNNSLTTRDSGPSVLSV